jgi:hypothetical protein
MASVSAALPPPWVLACPAVAITRPRPPAIGITARTPAVITAARPRVRVTQDRPPLAAPVIHLASRPQGPWRMPLPPVLRAMLEVPPRRPRPR